LPGEGLEEEIIFEFNPEDWTGPCQDRQEESIPEKKENKTKH